jgi:hypothetical protein
MRGTLRFIPFLLNERSQDEEGRLFAGSGPLIGPPSAPVASCIMPWRGLVIAAVVISVLVAYAATDTGARLLISGSVVDAFGGVRVGDAETEAVALLRRRFGEPIIIAPEPAPRFRIRPYERYVFRDGAPFTAVIVLDVRDGRVFRLGASYTGLFG